MKKENIDLFICDFCGQHSRDEFYMQLHEDICPLNPKNQPCSMCENLILGLGCSKGIAMESVDGKKVLCFFYKKGYPQNPFNSDKNTIDGNHEGDF